MRAAESRAPKPAPLDPRLLPFLDELAALLAARWLKTHAPHAQAKGGKP